MARAEKKEVTKAATPAHPFRALAPFAAWEKAMERWFDDFRRRTFPSLAFEQEWPFAELGKELPAVDVRESESEIVVNADLPGVSKDDIQVELRDTDLVIKGERKREKEVKEEDYYRCERSYGSFSRVIGLPAGIKADGAKATFKDGVLEIRLPKTEEAKRKTVKVQVK